MKNISEFFRTTSVSKLDIDDLGIAELFNEDRLSLPRSLPQTETEMAQEIGEFIYHFLWKLLIFIGGSKATSANSTPATLKRAPSVKDRWQKQFQEVHRASMRHRSIVLDSNDSGWFFSYIIIFKKILDLLKLRLAYDRQVAEADGKISLKTVTEHYKEVRKRK